ncbi:hypothetical protein [Rhabdothermincola salaria]|uniref:hypothetical protein n=1 Tax=Rhabdothermincola salaria TaxID=2903142 RepID=UPI001E3E857F|nr:hypothetical protein [Rhabdothermincola salaria]MCD9625273.1 hypothetical protein [Rhabdothermincola salaria]
MNEDAPVRPSLVDYMQDLAVSLPEPWGDVADSSCSTVRKVSSLIRAGGNKVMSPKLREELARAAAAAGLETDRPLSDPTLTPDCWVRFAKVPFADVGLLVPSENDLRRWVLSRVGRPGPFVHCDSPQVEFSIPGRKQRIDLLLKERGSAGRWTGLVVVEFELSSPSGTVGQVIDYLNLLAKTDMAQGKSLRGVIVSAGRYPREDQHLDREQPWPIEWWVLNAHLEKVAESPSP